MDGGVWVTGGGAKVTTTQRSGSATLMTVGRTTALPGGEQLCRPAYCKYATAVNAPTPVPNRSRAGTFDFAQYLSAALIQAFR